MTLMPFCTTGDIEVLWRPLTDSEEPKAQTLINYASQKVRRAVPGIDASIAAGDVDEVDAQMVVVGMVRRVLMSADTGDGVTSTSDAVGGVSQTRNYGNPMGNLYVTREDLRQLGKYSTVRMRSVRMVGGCG